MPPNNCWALEPKPSPQRIDLTSEVPRQLDDDTNARHTFQMINKEYSLIPALQKIFDEILVNATDNQLRNPKSCTRLEVSIDPGDNVENRVGAEHRASKSSVVETNTIYY